ncbi:hypothetical protein CAL7716_059100 [Calothrix sp. PCC 7716]|nr:hypothetical protein CAL7716_059100 [Calothrix sp. PCC 7716]
MTKGIDTNEVSPEYALFLKHYQDFLHHFNRCREITVLIHKQNVATDTCLLELSKEAWQAHIKAVNSYKKAEAAHQELRQKVVTDFLMQSVN